MTSPERNLTLHFTEEMKGFVTSTGEAEHEKRQINYRDCYLKGRSGQTDLLFHVTIHVADPHRLLSDPATPATLDGWIESPLFGAHCVIHDAAFQLFVPVSDQHHQMRYRIVFAGDDERLFTLIGFKAIEPGSLFEIWPDTTTLYTRIYAGVVDEWPDNHCPGAVLFAGILHIHPLDFLKQMTTFRTTPGGHLSALKDFFTAFARRLTRTYLLRR